MCHANRLSIDPCNAVNRRFYPNQLASADFALLPVSIFFDSLSYFAQVIQRRLLSERTHHAYYDADPSALSLFLGLSDNASLRRAYIHIFYEYGLTVLDVSPRHACMRDSVSQMTPCASSIGYPGSV